MRLQLIHLSSISLVNAQRRSVINLMMVLEGWWVSSATGQRFNNYRTGISPIICFSMWMDKTKEMVVDFRRACCGHSLLHINGFPVEIVHSSLVFLGAHIAKNFKRTLSTSSIAKKAQQHLYFLWRLRRAHLPPNPPHILQRDYMLRSCIMARYDNCSTSDHKTLQRIVRTEEKINVVSLPCISDIYMSASKKSPAPHTPPTPSSSSCLTKGSITYGPSLPGWETVFSLKLLDFWIRTDSQTIYHIPFIILHTLCPAATIVWRIYLLLIAGIQYMP